MSKRLSIVKIDASSVQGEGAYILWRRMTWGERREVANDIRADKVDVIAMLLDLLQDWNWVDADGEKLPLPQVADDLERLYDEEVSFLADVGRRAIEGRLEFTLDAEKN